jgi:hypothetical protein
MKLFTHLKVKSGNQEFFYSHYKPGAKIISFISFPIFYLDIKSFYLDIKSLTKFLRRPKRIFITYPLIFSPAIKLPYFFLARVKNYKSVFARGSPVPGKI